MLNLGYPQKALELARRARQEGHGNTPDFLAHGVEAIAQQQLGQERRADLLIEELRDRVERLPGPRWKGWAQEIPGRVALLRRRAEEAVAALEEAEQALPRRGDQNPRIWFLLGSSYIEAGRLTEAESRFESIVASHADRVTWPLEFVRSHYFLGLIQVQQGHTAQARKHYQRFLDYWEGGDLDRDEIAHARELLGRSEFQGAMDTGSDLPYTSPCENKAAPR